MPARTPVLPSTAVVVSTFLAVVLSVPTASAQSSRQEPAAANVRTPFPGPSQDLLRQVEEIYKDIHANPELAMQEHRTAGIAAAWLRKQGFEVTEKVGGTGVVGLLRNGKGSTVLLRADMDALPMQEDTGLPYASRKVGKGESGEDVPVAHSCGHDMHVAWLMGATRILAENKSAWHGTV